MNRGINARIITFLAVTFLGSAVFAKEPPRITASINPVYLLVAEVTEGVTEPHLLIKPSASPHHYTLTPKDAKALNDADIIFYIDKEFETFLEKPLKNLSKDAKVVTLAKEKGVNVLPVHERALWHEEEGHHDEHDGHDDHHEHHHGSKDLHIWLSPENAKAMVKAIADTLIAYDPERKATYQNNAKQAIARINQADVKIKTLLKPYKETPYIVFHDAYQYFEKHYGLHSIGALMLTPEMPLGAQTMENITKAVREHHVSCLFSEPQFDPKRLETIASYTNSHVRVLDPLETQVKENQHYGSLLIGLAESMVSCFEQTKLKDKR